MKFHVVLEPSDEGGYTVYAVEDDWVVEEGALVRELVL